MGLIDSKALKQDLMLYGLIVFADLDFVNKAVKIVNRQPTVDAVPVVRCKDCKYRYSGIDDSPCEIYDMPFDQLEDFFCADGERKSDETD